MVTMGDCGCLKGLVELKHPGAQSLVWEWLRSVLVQKDLVALSAGGSVWPWSIAWERQRGMV